MKVNITILEDDDGLGFCLGMVDFTDGPGDDAELPSINGKVHGHFCRISSLFVPVKFRRRMLASVLLASAIQMLEKRWTGLPIYIDAIPFADRGTDQGALFRLYRSFGFICVTGHPYSMRREAR